MKARKGMIDLKTRLQSQDEHAPPGPVQKAYARVLKSLAAEITRLEAAVSLIGSTQRTSTFRPGSALRQQRTRVHVGSLSAL